MKELGRQITKKQHYVPQFYLRQWTDKDKSFFPIEIKNKIPPNLNIFKNKSSPKRFCFENFFYAQYTGIEDETSQVIEKAFAEAEAIFANELPKIEKRILNNEHISEQDKYHLSECALFLYFRGKRYRDETKAMTEKMFKEINKRQVYFIDKNPKIKAEMEKLGVTQEEMIDFAEKGEYGVEFGNFHTMRIMKEMPGFCNILTAKYWRVYISRNGNFITSDTPYLDKATSDLFWGNDFLSREQTFILSPRVFIVARYPENENGKKFLRKDITNDEYRTQVINSINLMNSIKFGFHKDKTLLEKLRMYVNAIYQSKMSKNNLFN